MTMLLDIEGTTTSISFVYDELFPYARATMGAFLEANWHSEEVRKIIQSLRELEAADRADGRDVPPIAAESDGDAAVRASALANLLAQMDSDRKTTPLKAIQGLVWVDGYRSGALRGHVYDDVPVALRAWKDAGEPVYIYSSGSVAAQKLLFGHSVAGDLLPFLAGHFDTTTGPKKEAASYQAIADAIGVDAGSVTFATDNLDEARAAHEAGMRVLVSVRPGNPPLPEHPFEEIRSFEGPTG